MSAATVMEREVFSKHRQALMLFGIYHLTHAADPKDPSAVSIDEREYPNLTFGVTSAHSLPTRRPSPTALSYLGRSPRSRAPKGPGWMHGFKSILTGRHIHGQGLQRAYEQREKLQRPTEDFVDAFLYAPK